MCFDSFFWLTSVTSQRCCGTEAMERLAQTEQRREAVVGAPVVRSPYGRYRRGSAAALSWNMDSTQCHGFLPMKNYCHGISNEELKDEAKKTLGPWVKSDACGARSVSAPGPVKQTTPSCSSSLGFSNFPGQTISILPPKS